MKQSLIISSTGYFQMQVYIFANAIISTKVTYVYLATGWLNTF